VREYFAAQAEPFEVRARQTVEVVAGAGFGTAGHAEVEERSPADEEPAAVAVDGDVALAVPGVAHAAELAESEKTAFQRRQKRKAKKRRQAQRKKAAKVQQAPEAEVKDELPMAGAPKAANLVELAATAAVSEVVSRAENPAVAATAADSAAEGALTAPGASRVVASEAAASMDQLSLPGDMAVTKRQLGTLLARWHLEEPMSPCSARELLHAFIGSHVNGPVSEQLRERLRVCSEKKVRETYNGVLVSTLHSIRDQAVAQMGIMGVMEGAVHRSGELTLSAQEIRVFWNQIQIIDRQGLMQVMHVFHAELIALLRELEVEDIIAGAVRQRF
jgi:hypothetical protein